MKSHVRLLTRHVGCGEVGCIMCCWMLLCTLYSKSKFQLANLLMQGSVGVMTLVDCVNDCTQAGSQGL